MTTKFPSISLRSTKGVFLVALAILSSTVSIGLGSHARVAAATVPSAPLLGGGIRIVTDNDFAVFAGDVNNVTRIIAQNGAVWNTQISSSTTYKVNLATGESHIYLLAMGGGGGEDIGGQLNGVDITSIASGVDGIQRAVGRTGGTVSNGYLLLNTSFSDWADNSTNIIYGSYSPNLANTQTALTGATWGDPPARSGTGTPAGQGSSVTGYSYTFPSSTAVMFRIKATSLGEGLVSAGQLSANVSWLVPTSDGGSAILDYTVTAYNASTNAVSGNACTTPNGATRSCTVTGLTNGTAYYLKITARNSVGSSVSSDATTSVTPLGGPPTATWTVPTSSNSRTLSYTLTFDESVSGIASSDFSNVATSGAATGCSFTPSAASGTSVTVSVVCTSDGAVTVRLAASAVTDSDNTAGPTANSDASIITIDTVAPTVTIGVPNLDAASDLGVSSTDDTTSDATPTFTVSVAALEAGATGKVKATKTGSSDVTCTLSSGSCTLGTLAEGTWSIVSYQQDAAGNVSADSSALSVVIETTAPTVSSFSSTKTNGLYKAGVMINITATANESIQSGNTLTVTLETGATDRTVTLTASSAGTTLTGTYTVQAGDTTSDLTVASFTIGTVADTAGNAMTSTTLPTEANNIAGASAIVIDTTAPTTATLASSAATATSATITFTVTGNEQLDCTSLSTTAGTDFTLTAGILAISSITQTSNTLCTITATSTATAGVGAVTSTLTAAASFSVSDPAGNELTTLTGSPQSITVTVPSNTQTPEELARFVDECQRTNNSHPNCPGRQATTTTTTVATPTNTSTTTVAPRITTPTTARTQPRVSIPDAVTPKKVVVVTPVPRDDPTVIVAILRRELARDGDTRASNRVRSALTSAAPAIGESIADATEQLVKVLEDESSTKLEIIKAKATVADAAAQIILTALKATNGNNQTLTLPVTNKRSLPELEPGEASMITPTGTKPAQIKIVNNSTVVMTSKQENFSLTLSAVGSNGDLADLNARGAVQVALGQFLVVTGSGFKPNSKVAVWMLSSPRNFGSVPTNANGLFAAKVPIPDNIAPGDHTAQVNGQRTNGDTRSLNLGLEVVLEEAPSTATNKRPSTATKTVSARLRFNASSVVLTKTTQKKLIRISRQLRKMSDITVRCVGYTQEGRVSRRNQLAQRRANAVCQRLRKLGVNAKFEAVGLGRAKVTTAAARYVQLKIRYATSTAK